jgi:outer membrane immunogenic protein
MRAVLSAALSLSMAGTAIAADFPSSPYYGTPTPYTAYSWAGPYLGATLGYEWGRVSNNPTNPSGVAGGIEGGFNWQHGNFVYAGVAVGNVLIFGTAGLAYGSLTADTSGNLSETHTSVGWVAGGGAEVGLTPHWSAKAEWLYLDLADRSYSVTGTNNGLAANLLRLGVNYRF